MKPKTIPVLAEPAYLSSRWGKEILLALRQEAARHDSSVSLLEEVFPKSLEDPFYILVLGSDQVWIDSAVDKVRKEGGRPLLICSHPPDSMESLCIVAPDRAGMTTAIMDYLARAGRRRTALFGFNPCSASDLLRERVYFENINRFGLITEPEDVYLNDGSLTDCFARFIPVACRYNSVLCSNDAAAVFFMKAARDYSLRIPEDLFLIGNGNTKMGNLMSPGLTTVTLNYDEVGRHAVTLFHYLSRHPAIGAMYASVSCKIIPRGSTGFFEPGEEKEALGPKNGAPEDPFFRDPEVRHFFVLENLLNSCDSVDMGILAGLTGKTPYDRLADELHISVHTLKYRLKKIFSSVGVKTREEFLELIRPYPLILS